jgi:hypothetical protein
MPTTTTTYLQIVLIIQDCEITSIELQKHMKSTLQHSPAYPWDNKCWQCFINSGNRENLAVSITSDMLASQVG